jgi:hypothetical protein
MAIDDERERIPVMILLICWSAELGQKVNLGFSANTSTSPPNLLTKEGYRTRKLTRSAFIKLNDNRCCSPYRSTVRHDVQRMGR